jgi:hypothetical protein
MFVPAPLDATLRAIDRAAADAVAPPAARTERLAGWGAAAPVGGRR